MASQTPKIMLKCCSNVGLIKPGTVLGVIRRKKGRQDYVSVKKDIFSHIFHEHCRTVLKMISSPYCAVLAP